MMMSKDWMEKREKRVKLEDCSAEALGVAVDFMYGINNSTSLSTSQG